MSTNSTRDLLLHEMGDLLYVERSLIKVLPKMCEEVSNSTLRQSMLNHLEQTKGHITNLEKAFEVLGEKPKAEKCPAFDGIRKEHDDFLKEEKPDAVAVIDDFASGSAMRVEHYEIAAYTGACGIAERLGESEVAELLQCNLDEELHMLEEIEEIAPKLAVV
jgi:ferritin-like metal-binding protein YciE